MVIHNVGYNHTHDADFFIDRPEGSGDYLLLLLKTEALFVLQGKEVLVPANSVMLYRKGTPQQYRCCRGQIFSNDWVHFLFEGNEEEAFLRHGIPFDTPISMENLHFLSFCLKCIAGEQYSNNRNKHSNIGHYMALLFSKIDEQLHAEPKPFGDTGYEMLSTIRYKIYSEPYIQRTVEYASHEVRMSRSAFQHLYREQFGVSFVQDLIESRTQYAKMLLSTTNLSVHEVASQCGYRSYAHFSRQFKERTGITPSEYRLSCSYSHALHEL